MVAHDVSSLEWDLVYKTVHSDSCFDSDIDMKVAHYVSSLE